MKHHPSHWPDSFSVGEGSFTDLNFPHLGKPGCWHGKLTVRFVVPYPAGGSWPSCVERAPGSHLSLPLNCPSCQAIYFSRAGTAFIKGIDNEWAKENHKLSPNVWHLLKIPGTSCKGFICISSASFSQFVKFELCRHFLLKIATSYSCVYFTIQHVRLNSPNELQMVSLSFLTLHLAMLVQQCLSEAELPFLTSSWYCYSGKSGFSSILYAAHLSFALECIFLQTNIFKLC